MFRTNLILVALYFVSNSLIAQKGSPLSVQKIMADPKITIGTSPSNIWWSADSKTVYFNWNPDNNISDSLYSYALDSQKTTAISKKNEKDLIPEKGDISQDFSQKVYEKDGDIYLADLKSFTIKRITFTTESETKPFFLFHDQEIAYYKNQNIYSFELKTGLTKQLTHVKSGSKKSEDKKNEQQEWLEKEQLALFEVVKERKDKKDLTKKRNEAHKPDYPKEIYDGDKLLSDLQISPDSKIITYNLTKKVKDTKATNVPSYVTETGFTENLPARTKVGAKLEPNEFWIFDTEKDTTIQLNISKLEGISDKPDYLKDYPKQDSLWKNKKRDCYIHGPYWSKAGNHAILVIRSLDSKDRWIVALDKDSLSVKVLDRQRDEAWVGGPGVGGYPMGGGLIDWLDEDTFYFQSEQSGYSHLYSYNLKTTTKKQLTDGRFEVQSVVLTRDKKTFYLTTNESHPGEQHVYKMSVQGGKREKLTSDTGAYEFTISPDEKKLALRYSTSNQPWELYIGDNQNPLNLKKITASQSEQFKNYPWRKAKIVKISATDGESIYARVYEPKKSNGKAVIFVHGAGYLQNAHTWWSQYYREYMFHNLLTDKGYMVLDMDYRASAGYGRDWRTGIYRHMGDKDLSDNVDGANWLVKNYNIKSDKIGIYGGSYGGFITLMALFTKPDVFKAGAALRPVTDWAAYNHPYTANILNEPQTDSLAYRRSSPIYHAAGLKNHLLICHGMVDVNVHYQDVVRLSQRLIELGKENWELASYPMEDHGFVEPSSWTDEYKRILKLFEDNL